MTHENNLGRVSLLGLFISASLIIILPPLLGVGLAYWMIDSATQARVEKLQARIQVVDAAINSWVFTVKSTGGASCQLQVGYFEREYADSGGVLLAKDTLVQDKADPCLFELIAREYYESGTIIARDTFGLVEGCADKRREYYDSNRRLFLQECFSKAGIGYTKKYWTIRNEYRLIQNATRSPFPPSGVFFVYFYR